MCGVREPAVSFSLSAMAVMLIAPSFCSNSSTDIRVSDESALKMGIPARNDGILSMANLFSVRSVELGVRSL
jgi:hypothetical protein